MPTMRRLLLPITMSVLLLSGSSVQSYSQCSALAASYQFQNTGGTLVLDSSGLGNNGSLFGAANFLSSPFGGVVSILGPSGLIQVPYSNSLTPAIGTFQIWVNVATGADVDVVSMLTDRFVRSNVNGGFGVYGIRLLKNGSVSGYLLNDDPESRDGAWTSLQTQPNGVTPGEWHFVAMRWDGHTLAMFIDGKLSHAVGYFPVPEIGLSYSGTYPLSIAAATWWFGNFDHEFIGDLADARLYSCARSEIQIEGDYQAKVPPKHR